MRTNGLWIGPLLREGSRAMKKSYGLCFLLFFFALPVHAQFGLVKAKRYLDVEHPPEICIPGRQLGAGDSG